VSATTARGEQTRDAILVAATEVVLEAGPDKFSLREVARRAGLAPSALYNHFPNREAIIQATAVRALGELRASLGTAPEGMTAADTLRGLARAYLSFAEHHVAEYRLIFECLENPPIPWEAYLAVAEPFTLIVEACRRGLEAGEFSDRNGVGAGGLAYGLWTLCHGHASLVSRTLVLVDGDFGTLALAAIDTFLGGLAAGDHARH